MSEEVELMLLADVRSLESECARLRDELERLRHLVPTGTYTLNVQYEEEIQRLKDATAKMRDALRAAEKRELEALAELDEARDDIETLKTHVETVREGWRGASEAVTKLGDQLHQSETDCERYAELLDDCRDLLMTQYDPEDNIATIKRIEEALGVCKPVARI